MASRPYVYAIIDSPVRVDDVPGLAGDALRLIEGPACWVVAGTVAEMPSTTRATLEAQDAIVRALAARADALLPFRFGAAFDDDAALTQSLMRLDADRVRAALSRVRGCEQMTLRLFRAAHAPAFEENAASTAATAAPADAARPGTAYLHRRAAVMHAHTSEWQTLREQLADVVRDEIVQAAKQPPLVASMFHLIARGGDAAARYAAIVSAWPAPADLDVRLSGPAPPYAFAKDAML